MSRDRTVLIVDDEPSTLDFLAATVRAMGVRVEAVADGQAALASAASRRPDLVLLDALLPKMDGFQVLAALKKAHPDVPVIMMSGIYRKRSYETEAVDRLGALEYLCKPIPVLKLWELVEQHAAPGPVEAPPPNAPPGAKSFSANPLPVVVARLFRERATGLLLVRGSGGTAVLFFEDGAIIFGRSSDPMSRLDRVLHAMGRLDAAGAARAQVLVAESKGRARVGELLVANGLVTQEDVSHALTEQQRLHVLRPFAWTSASSHFVASNAPRDETFKLSFDMEALVVWGCRAFVDDSMLHASLPLGSDMLRLHADPQALALRFSLTPGEVELLQLADGSREFAKLRAIGRLAQVDVPRLSAAFLCLGLASSQAAPPGRAARDAPAVACAPVRAVGDLEQTPPAVLLVSLHFARKTGILRASAPGGTEAAQRTVYFERGCIAFASSTAPEDRLGQVLLRAGLVTNADLAAALASANERPGVPLGRLLVDQGALCLDDLHRGLVAQVQHVVTSLVGWRRGSFRFDEDPLPLKDIVPLSLNTLETVLVALRGSAFTELAARLPETKAILRRAPACFDLAGEFPLSPMEDTLLLTLDRGASLSQVLARLSEPPEQVFRAYHVLASVGLVETVLNTAVDSPLDHSYPRLLPEIEVFGQVPDRDDTGERTPAAGEMSFGGLWDECGDEGFDPEELPGPTTMPAPVEVTAAAAPARAASTATAVLERAPEPSVEAFLAALAAHVAREQATLPDEIRALLPAALRHRHGL